MSLFIWPLFESESDPLAHCSLLWSHLNAALASLWDDPWAVLLTWQTAVTSALHFFCSHSHQLIGNLSREILSGNLTSAFQVLEGESESLFEYLDLTDFQWKLIREFSLILLGNLLLVFLAWKVYGPRITAKFFTEAGGSHSQVVKEAWRSSVSQLKLPKEHDFKYK